MTTVADYLPGTRRRLGSCADCLAWGLLPGSRCRTCLDLRARHPVGLCRGCGRSMPVRKDVCRLCRKQATLIARLEGHAHRRVDLTVAARTGQQLFFANLEGFAEHNPVKRRSAPRQKPASAVAPLPASRPRVVQLMLCQVPHDCRCASALTPPLDPALLATLLSSAEALAEQYGWGRKLHRQVRWGLKILAGCHQPGEPIYTSTLRTLTDREIPAQRLVQVLHAVAPHLLVEDRADPLAGWIKAQFAGLPDTMRDDLQAWVDALRGGGPRRRPRPEATVRALLARVRPFLTHVAARHHTLRQVARDDITDWLAGRPHADDDLYALRNLFRVLKTQRLVFVNPTAAIHRSRHHRPTPRALDQQSLHQLTEATGHDPQLRAVLALIGVHALQPRHLRTLLLDDVDLPNHRLHLEGGYRTLDSFTQEAITAYLKYRRNRWPRTSNPHLFISTVRAHDGAPVDSHWLQRLFHGLATTPTQLRQDRYLEEARATGADPLHLAVVFGLHTDTAQRYASVAAPELTATTTTNSGEFASKYPQKS